MHRRLLGIAVVGLAALLLAAGASAAYKTVVRNPFTGQTQTRPASFTLAQDGSVGLSKLKWVGWGSGTATGIGVDSYRLWPAFKYAKTSGTIQLSRRTICHGKIYYARAVATVTSLKYGGSTPHTRAEGFNLLPPGC